MLELFLSPEVMPFAVSIAVMVIIGLIEGVGTLLGFALSGLLDNLMPDVDFDVDAPDMEHGAFSEFLTWLRIRDVPVIAIIIAFLTSFGVTGMVMQQVLLATLGFMLPLMLAVPAAFILCMPGVRFFAGVLSAIMPKDETSAVSTDTFIGRVATITLGSAEQDNPAQAKLVDEHGQTHYVMVEPDRPAVSFEQGAAVLLVAEDGHLFKGILSDNEHLD